eukprot:TRINITY_DN1079_c1_g1_i1.p1 TRINITY_DN1079_c1_g1~~TRINITY_DN1079_c1_g1_i1.p1  ORF type:complete len:661 (+),score=220.45 TRINITY_DN1079_c1_g1_i1:69-1985(+)
MMMDTSLDASLVSIGSNPPQSPEPNVMSYKALNDMINNTPSATETFGNSTRKSMVPIAKAVTGYNELNEIIDSYEPATPALKKQALAPTHNSTSKQLPIGIPVAQQGIPLGIIPSGEQLQGEPLMNANGKLSMKRRQPAGAGHFSVNPSEVIYRNHQQKQQQQQHQQQQQPSETRQSLSTIIPLTPAHSNNSTMATTQQTVVNDNNNNRASLNPTPSDNTISDTVKASNDDIKKTPNKKNIIPKSIKKTPSSSSKNVSNDDMDATPRRSIKKIRPIRPTTTTTTVSDDNNPTPIATEKKPKRPLSMATKKRLLAKQRASLANTQTPKRTLVNKLTTNKNSTMKKTKTGDNSSIVKNNQVKKDRISSIRKTPKSTLLASTTKKSHTNIASKTPSRIPKPSSTPMLKKQNKKIVNDNDVAITPIAKTKMAENNKVIVESTTKTKTPLSLDKARAELEKQKQSILQKNETTTPKAAEKNVKPTLLNTENLNNKMPTTTRLSQYAILKTLTPMKVASKRDVNEAPIATPVRLGRMGRHGVVKKVPGSNLKKKSTVSTPNRISLMERQKLSAIKTSRKRKRDDTNESANDNNAPVKKRSRVARNPVGTKKFSPRTRTRVLKTSPAQSRRSRLRKRTSTGKSVR